MSLYRCAACGSPNVVTEKENGGYSYAKGAIGTAVLGVGGAVAGINGKTKQVFKCPDCGLTLNEPMIFELKTLIDIGVSSVNARDSLMLNGVKISWEQLKNKYKNIEDSDLKQSLDLTKETKREKTIDNENNISNASILSQEELERNKKLYEKALGEYEKLYVEWADKFHKIELTRITELSGAIKQSEKDRLHQMHVENAKKTCCIKEAIDELYKTKVQLEREFSRLNFFNFSEKKRLKKSLEEIDIKISDEKNRLSYLETKLEREISSVKNGLSNEKEVIKKRVYEQYPLPLRPDKPNDMVIYKSTGEKTTPEELVKHFMLEEIFKFVEKNKYATIKQIMQIESLSDMTERFVKGLLDTLIEKEELRYLNEKYKVNGGGKLYFEIKNKQSRLEHEERNDRIKKEINNILKSKGEALSITELQKNSELLANCTTSKIAVIITQLFRENLIDRIEDKQIVKFKLK